MTWLLSFDAIFLISFAAAMTAIILYEKRHGENLEVQKIISYFLYAVLYRTRWGLDAMDRFAHRFSRFFRFTVPLIIASGVLGMIGISILLVWMLYDNITADHAIPAVMLVLPVESAITFYVPALYWIVTLVLIASVHEMAHGIIARLYDIKVKSSGFAFFSILVPIIPAAFVEPDEKDMAKRPAYQQLAVFAAGPFSNFVFGALCILLLIAVAPFALNVADDSAGVRVDLLDGNVLAPAGFDPATDTITSVNEHPTPSLYEFHHPDNPLFHAAPGDQVSIGTPRGDLTIIVAEHPELPERGFLGVTNMSTAHANPAFERQSTIVQLFLYSAAGFYQAYTLPDLPDWATMPIVWIIGLISFLLILNFGLGLANLLPIFIADGGRILFTLIHGVLRVEEARALSITVYISIVFFIVLLVSLFLPIVRPYLGI